MCGLGDGSIFVDRREVGAMAVDNDVESLLGVGVLGLQFWFMSSGRWVVESDVDGGVGASTEYVVRVPWKPLLKRLGSMEEELREECFGPLAEAYGGLGLELPDVEVVFFSGGVELMRVRWDWVMDGFCWLGGKRRGRV